MAAVPLPDTAVTLVCAPSLFLMAVILAMTEDVDMAVSSCQTVILDQRSDYLAARCGTRPSLEQQSVITYPTSHPEQPLP